MRVKKRRIGSTGLRYPIKLLYIHRKERKRQRARQGAAVSGSQIVESSFLQTLSSANLLVLVSVAAVDKAKVAYLASKRALSGVETLVSIHIARAPRALATNIAREHALCTASPCSASASHGGVAGALGLDIQWRGDKIIVAHVLINNRRPP